jgi:hypothetical protein
MKNLRKFVMENSLEHRVSKKKTEMHIRLYLQKYIVMVTLINRVSHQKHKVRFSWVKNAIL